MSELARFAWLEHEAGRWRLDQLAAYVSASVDKRVSVALAPREYFLRLEAGAEPSPREQWLRANTGTALRVATFRGATYRCSWLPFELVLRREITDLTDVFNTFLGKRAFCSVAKSAKSAGFYVGFRHRGPPPT